jgi:hypothetical protein
MSFFLCWFDGGTLPVVPELAEVGLIQQEANIMITKSTLGLLTAALLAGGIVAAGAQTTQTPAPSQGTTTGQGMRQGMQTDCVDPRTGELRRAAGSAGTQETASGGQGPTSGAMNPSGRTESTAQFPPCT